MEVAVMKYLLAGALIAAGVCSGADVRSSSSSSLDDGYRQMYNLQFEAAHQTIHDWEKTHPGDPLGPVSDAAAYLFAEFDRLHVLQSEFFSENDNFLNMHKLTPDPQVKREFESVLDQAKALEAGSAQQNPGDPDMMFATVMTHGLASDYLGMIEKRYLAALGETKLARSTAEQLLAAQPGYYDAYLAIGVENYLLSLKPAPMRWLLRATGAETDKEVGLQKVHLTADKGHYLLPFARLLLVVADLRNKDTARAREELTWLAAQFPANHLFRDELAKIK
jgi:hypothetical protein